MSLKYLSEFATISSIVSSVFILASEAAFSLQLSPGYYILMNPDSDSRATDLSASVVNPPPLIGLGTSNGGPAFPVSGGATQINDLKNPTGAVGIRFDADINDPTTGIAPGGKYGLRINFPIGETVDVRFSYDDIPFFQNPMIVSSFNLDQFEDFNNELLLLGISLSETGNINVVPEPLTILGAGTAIAFGTTFKRKLIKAKKNKKN